MGSSNSSRSLTEERQSDEIVKPFWRLVTGYIDELCGLRQSKPVVLSSTSDTIGIGRPLYMDRIKRVWPRESVHCNSGESDDDGQSKELSKTTKEAPDESNVSVATSRRLLSDHRTRNESPGSSRVWLDELRRRGVTIIQCHDTPRPLPPPPPGEDDDIAASTDSMCSSLGPSDNTTHEEVVVPPAADSSSKAQLSRKPTKCRRNVAVMPENHFPYSIQDSRHWNKTIVLTATGSRVAWTTRREVHSLRMQRCSETRLEISTAVHPPDTSCDTMGSKFAGNNLHTVWRGQRLHETSSGDSIEDSRRQDTKGELIEYQLDDKHQTHCGTTSEHVIPGSSGHQRTHTEKRHPIVTNILVMLGAETKDNKVSDAEQRVPNITLQTTTNHAKHNHGTRLFETSSHRTEDTMTISPRSTELRSTGFTHASSYSGVPEIGRQCPLNTMSELCNTRSAAPDDRIQRTHHSETPTSKTIRPLQRKVPQHIGRKSTADLVRILSFIYT